MAYTNIPPNLQDMFYSLDDRIRKLESGPSSAATDASAAYSTAVAAQTTATVAQTTADGKNTVTYSTSGPGSTANIAGDIWFQYTTGGVIIAQWTGAGGTTWNSNTLDSAVIASLDAGKITAGTISVALALNASTGIITGGTIQTSAGSSAVILKGSTNSIDFKNGGSSVGHIVPLSSNGVIMHYGATADGTGGTFPQIYVGSANCSMTADATHGIGVSTTAGTIMTGDARVTNRLGVGIDPASYTTGDLAVNRYIYNPNITTTTSAANLFVGSTGQYIKSTASSERYKENIANITTVDELDPKKLLDLPVRAFTYKEGELPEEDARYGKMIPGFIAEEVSNIYPIAADHQDGQAESWNERMIVPALLSLVQDLSKRVAELETQLSKQ